MALSLFRKSHIKRPSTARNERIYAVGDVHGRYDLLKQLMSAIEAHHDRLPPTDTTYVVFLGDLVDRGPDTALVLEHLFESSRKNSNIIILRGNHEDMMLRSLAREPGMLRAWMRIGGRATMRSFGLEPPDPDSDPGAFFESADRRIPSRLMDWLNSLPLSAKSGDYFFCHAGVRPGVALARQKRSDMLWIRDDFLKSDVPHGAIVVHGHSVSLEVESRPNRIGIDTGAYRTGVLTALYLEATDRELLTVRE